MTDAATMDDRRARRAFFRAGRGLSEASAWVATPETARPGAAPLVVVHGISRDAEGIARRLAARASAQGRVLIAPLFAKDAFPGYQRVLEKNRPDRALLALIAALADEGLPVAGRFDLAGYSGGAQFAHRFARLHPRRVGRLVVAAAGWWTFPEDAPYPRGLGDAARAASDPVELMRRNTAAFLDREIEIAVGAKDCVPDAAMRSERALDARQGPDRLTRAWRWRAALLDAAARHGVAPRVRLTILPFCGHDFHACGRAGLDRLMLPDPVPGDPA